MKFRIIAYYDRYKAQVCEEAYDGFKWYDRWSDIGAPSGYPDINSAKVYCAAYRDKHNEKVIEEFEL